MKKILGFLICFAIVILIFLQNYNANKKQVNQNLSQSYNYILIDTENRTMQTSNIAEEQYTLKVDSIRVLLTNNAGGYYWTSEEILDHKELTNYPGEIFIVSEESGYLVINKVKLDEYLIYVTASEMPASFEMEALKAQAVCARTYAVRQMKDGRLKDYYADVDDTAAFQVYSYKNYNERVKQAVEETKGMILTYENEPIEAFYYSCSGGIGTTPLVWANNEENNEYPYFQANVYGTLEEQSPWYRWSYYAPAIDFACMKEKILWKYEHLQEKVKVFDQNGSLVSGEEAEQFLNSDYIVRDLKIEEYQNDAFARVLALFCDGLTIRIYGENNIRYILADSNQTLICQDGSKHQMDLLPSGYFRMYCSYSIDEDNNSQLLGLRVNGGGFGHGIGLSQYGAHYLAGTGKNFQDILTYYYQNVSLSLMETAGD